MINDVKFRVFLKDWVHFRSKALEDVERSIAELDMKRKQLERDLEQARRDRARAIDYQPYIDGAYICPDCWMRFRQSRLQVVGTRGGRPSDTYKCNTCAADFYAGDD